MLVHVRGLELLPETYLVDEGELQAKVVRDGGGPLRPASVGTDDDGFPPLGDALLDVPL